MAFGLADDFLLFSLGVIRRLNEIPISPFSLFFPLSCFPFFLYILSYSAWIRTVK